MVKGKEGFYLVKYFFANFDANENNLFEFHHTYKSNYLQMKSA